MAKYKDSFQTHSESLAAGGRSILTAVENKDTHTRIQKAPPPEFDKPKHTSSISSIRTLADDMQSAAQSGKVSLASEALRSPLEERVIEERASEPIPTKAPKPEKTKTTKRSSSGYFVIIALVLFIFGGSLYLFTARQGIPIGSLSFSFPKISVPSFSFGSSGSNDSDLAATNPDTLLVVDHYETFSINPLLGRVEIERKLRELEGVLQPGVTAVFAEALPTLTEDVEQPNSAPVPLDINALFGLLEVSVSEALPRSIDDYTLGLTQDGGSTQVFLVAKTRDFDNSFGALLDWEKEMAFDLYNVFHRNSSAVFGGISFTDTAVLGVHARELVTSTEFVLGVHDRELATEPVIVYAFPDKDTLVITHSKEALREIITRLKSTN